MPARCQQQQEGVEEDRDANTACGHVWRGYGSVMVMGYFIHVSAWSQEEPCLGQKEMTLC